MKLLLNVFFVVVFASAAIFLASIAAIFVQVALQQWGLA